MPVPMLRRGLQVDTRPKQQQQSPHQHSPSKPSSRKHQQQQPTTISNNIVSLHNKHSSRKQSVSPSKKTTQPVSPGFMKTTAAADAAKHRRNNESLQNASEDSSEFSLSDREIALEKLRASLSRFTRSGNRRMMLRTLKDNRSLSAIPVLDINANFYNPETDYEWKELEVAVARTVPISLNGMLIGNEATTVSPTEHHHSNTGGREGKKFLQLLRLLCNRLAVGLMDTTDDGRNGSAMTSVDLYQTVLQRLAREPSELTAMDHVRPLLETPELSLEIPIAKKTNTIAVGRVPTLLTLYVADGYAHCTVQHVHQLGLFRKQDAPSRPFCSLTAKVHERVNLTTGNGVKQVAVSVLEDKMFALYGH